MSELSQLQLQIDEAMLADRHRLRRRLRSIRADRRSDRAASDDDRLRRLAEQVESSRQRRQQRLQRLPAVTFDGGLPIEAHRQEIADALREHQVIVVCGETGSGKSTQLPKICLELSRGVEGMIGHTQPRRIAARSIATRLAQELRCSLGEAVGYQVRFQDQTGPGTYVKLMTDGILLAETQHDRFLERYDTIILDEAHERSLNIDFLLGYIKRLLPKRPELRLIITSATIDVERFCNHFGQQDRPAPLIEVSGRTYPVEVRYRPLTPGEDGSEPDPRQALSAAVEELCGCGRGDILVFLPAERDIRDAARTLRGWAQHRREPGGVEILPLYARLSAAEQQRVFQPHSGRRIVLATNVAESSLTVPGIRYVIDEGTARISRYAPRSKVQRLPIEDVSQASAQQRMGRCGRLGPGVCIRLYSEDDFLSRDRYTTPEIRRTNLASVVLQTKALRLGPIEEFPFLEPPRPEAVRDGYKTLFELGAVDQSRQLTGIGRRLSRLPVDPRIGRMILAGDELGCLNEILIIAAALELQDPRERPVDKQQAADEAHAQHAHPESDYFSLLNLWDFYAELKQKLSRSQLRKALRQNFLSLVRMHEWLDIHRQLRQLAKEAGMKVAARRDDYEAVHRALLSGLLSNVAFRSDRDQYSAAAGVFHLWPGSGVFRKQPAWVMAAELVETSRRYLRTVARIQPGWIEPAARHLVKRSYSDPHWSDKAGAAMTHEKVTLFGLTVSAGRRVPLAPIDPPQARQLLIRHGLAEARLRTRPAFLDHNLQVLQEIEALSARSRRRDLLVDESQLWQFYEDRLPEDVCDPGRLNQWLKQAERSGQRPLHMQISDLVDVGDSAASGDDFPDQLEVAQLRLPLEYEFRPGEEHDGVSARVPREALNQLRPERLGWLVPGLLEEKVLALIRSLPKSLRRNFVPAPDTARQVARSLEYGAGAFLESVAARLSQLGGERVTAADFRTDKLPPHLQLNVQVIDDRGELLAEGRDVGALQAQLGGAAADAGPLAIDHQDWSRDQLRDWTFGDLPEQVVVRRGGLDVPAFPALLDQGDSVSLRLLDTRESAERESRRGVRRLFVLLERKELATQVKWLPGLDRLAVLGGGLPDRDQLRAELIDLLGQLAFFPPQRTLLPRAADEFQQRRKLGRRAIAAATQDLAQVLQPLLENYHRLRLLLEELTAAPYESARADVQQQLDELTRPGFLSHTPWQWLQHYPRYLQAAAARLEKLRGGGQVRDRKQQQQLEPHLQRWHDLPPHRAAAEPFERYRWMLEEYRVSLFAQELGTSETVSPQRLDKQWARAEKEV